MQHRRVRGSVEDMDRYEISVGEIVASIVGRRVYPSVTHWEDLGSSRGVVTYWGSPLTLNLRQQSDAGSARFYALGRGGGRPI